MKKILTKSILLTPKNNKTNIIIPFELDNKFNRLNFKTVYSPKFLEDDEKSKLLIENALNIFMADCEERSKADWRSYLPLGNLVTFSLDAEDKHLGCVHRGEPKQDFFVGADDASLGLETYRIVEGEYRVVLNVHCIITESCEYRLEIYAE